VEYRRDFLEVLLGQLDDTERSRLPARLGARNAAARLTTMYGRAARSGVAVGIFTSHRDGVTTIQIHTPGGVPAATFRAVLDHGMRAGEPLLVVDLCSVSFLDAAALDVLAGAESLAARRGSRILVRRAQPAVFEEFVAAGLVPKLDTIPNSELPGKGAS
jgi:anti-anti-sigma regulatory factor